MGVNLEYPTSKFLIFYGSLSWWRRKMLIVSTSIYFEDYSIVSPSKAFKYKNSFDISAKRLNLTDSMTLEIYQTQIIGYA